MAEVVLTWSEIMLASEVGVMRQVTNLRDSRQDAHGMVQAGGFEIHCCGAIGELAVAKWLNRYWSGSLGNLRVADVGPLQVRTTWHRDGKLILRKTDSPKAVWILVKLYEIPIVNIIGWIAGHDARDAKYLTTLQAGRPECYAVPGDRLRRMEDLEI